MSEAPFITAFLIGLAGGVHCYGMCGGITLAMRAASPPNQPHLPYAISYHCGRIISYSAAGLLTGTLGWLVSTSSSTGAQFLSLLSIAMLVMMALYIGQWYRGLTKLEQLGSVLWRRLRPLSQRFIPFKSPFAALPYGMIWGWLPCGLVYSTLTWSLASEHPLTGAAIMASFGMGTFPTMLLASLAASRVMKLYQHPITRQCVALSLILYAGILIYRIL